MNRQIEGIHHVTALASDPQANADFYTGVLGLRLVKRTVNFDDPGTYHLYFGDELGRPGTLLTCFPWPGARRGTRGAGQATVTSFAVPQGSLGWWGERLASHGVLCEPPRERFAEETLTLFDPDGLQLELVAHAEADRRAPWEGGPVPPEHAVRGLAAVALAEWNPEVTARLLTETMGFRAAGEAGNRFRFAAGDGGPGTRVDLLATPDAPRGHIAAGTVHHVAWRVATDGEQEEWRRDLATRGLDVTPILDRQYFHSIYFREPGGVLFEIATDPPGFTWDEAPAELGSGLKLPPWLEPARAEIAAALPRLEVRASAAAGAR
jgi:glyoxalase family protein